MEAAKPEEQFTEDTPLNNTGEDDGACPGLGNYPPRLSKVHFPPPKGYARGGGHLLSQKLPQQPGTVGREATATVQTQGLSDPGSHQV